MTEFWLFIIVMLVIALAIVVLPLMYWRPAPLQLDERLRLNVGVYQQRLSELDADYEKELLDSKQFAQLKTELQRSLLIDTDRQQSQAAQVETGKAGKALVYVLLLLIPVISWAFYDKLGSIDDWAIKQLMQDMILVSQQGGDASAEQKKLLSALENRLKDRPEIIEYQVLLAKSYMKQEQFDQAAVVYAKLVELLPQDSDAHAYYAQSLFLARGRKIDAAVQKAIDATLALNPHNVTVLGMVGMNAFDQGNYHKAIESWQKIITILPPGSPDVTMLKQGVEHVRKILTDRGEEPPMALPEEKISGVSLTVSVALKAGLMAKPEQTVFIFAKAAQGPPMPLAVVRLQVKDLPKTVTLDDSMAMAPTMKLSDFAEVTVMARISSSGGATVQSGDLQGTSGTINTGDDSSIELLIDQTVP